MTELIIERWTNLNQSIDYRWSVWVDGRRVQMGGPHKTADESEREGRANCRKELGAGTGPGNPAVAAGGQN